MKKIMSMAIVLIALVTLSVSAFAADNGKQISESTFQENVVVKVSNAGKFMKEEEEFEILTPEEISSMEETEDPDALLEGCPKCGKIHDGCCAEEAERIHFRHYVDTDYSYLKFCDLKDNALYFVTLDNNLMLMNLKTKQLYFIADEVMGLTRYGMNGRYIGYVTLNDKFFSVPYEVGKDGKLSTDFQMEFGE